MNVGYGTVEGASIGGALGSSITNYYTGSNYADLKAALLAQAAPGSSTLPSSAPVPGTLQLSYAQSGALGIADFSSSLNGYAGFLIQGGSLDSSSYTIGVAPSAGKYYLPSEVWHELTEVMGRVSQVVFQPGYYSVPDLYRWSSATTRNLTANSGTAYFSVDGGTTNLGTWNNTSPGQGDLGDWRGSPYPSGGANDACNDYSGTGVINVFSASDAIEMAALGFQLTAAGHALAGI